jgi:membrane protease YdiL (CAAX protease family)
VSADAHSGRRIDQVVVMGIAVSWLARQVVVTTLGRRGVAVDIAFTVALWTPILAALVWVHRAGGDLGVRRMTRKDVPWVAATATGVTLWQMVAKPVLVASVDIVRGDGPGLAHVLLVLGRPIELAPRWPSALNAMTSLLVAPILEELAFRGVFLRAGAPEPISLRRLLAVSMGFGFNHLTVGADRYGVAVGLVLAGAGLAYGVLARRRRNACTSIIGHAIVNAGAIFNLP